MVTGQLMDGRPRGRQVDLLVEQWGAMREGQIISHEEIEKLIGETRVKNSARYFGIIGSARKRFLHEQGIRMATEVGVGYKMPTGFEQLRTGTGQVGRAVRRIGQGYATVAAVQDNRLPDPKHRLARDHIVTQARLLHELGRAHRKAMNLTIGKPETAPQPQLPGSAAGSK